VGLGARGRSLRPIDGFIAAVSTVGIALLAVLGVSGGFLEIGRSPAAFCVLGAFAVVGELFPVRLPRRDDSEEITTSTPLGFALMLGWGTGAAAVALAGAALSADLRRKPPWKALFNMAAYVLSIGAAGGVYRSLGGSTRIAAGDAGAIAAAALTFFVVNTVIVEIAVAMSQGLPPLFHLRRHLAFQSVTAGILLCLGPVVVVLAQRSLLLLPLLALPLASVHWAARTSVENAKLAEQNRLKDDLIAVVSHELRTPLTSIQGYVKSLLRLGGSLSPSETREFLAGADRQSDRLNRLVEELLVLGRLDARVESIEVSTVDLPALAAGVVDELRETATNHRVVLALEDLPMVPTDEAKLHRILSNLIENALKYSAPGTSVWVGGRRRRGEVERSVRDEGPGIPSGSRDRIFERFYRVDRPEARTVGGTGLGLYICRRLAESIGGRVALERSGPDGSAFSLSVPLNPPGVSRGSHLEELQDPVRPLDAVDSSLMPSGGRRPFPQGDGARERPAPRRPFARRGG